MSSPDDQNFLKWTEKVKTVIRRIYNEDSPECREITEINRASLAMAAISNNAEILDQNKKDARRKIIMLEAWAELEKE